MPSSSSKNEYKIQLADLDGRALFEAGEVIVVEKDAYVRLALTDLDGAAATNALSFTNGQIEFQVANTINAVDIYYNTNNGYSGLIKGVKPGELTEFKIDRNRLEQTILIPFDAADTDYITATTEFDTGFDLSTNTMVMVDGVGVYVATADSAETIDVGTQGTSDDPDGFLDALLLTNTGFVQGTIGFDVGGNAAFVALTGGDQEYTLGALLCGTGTIAAVAAGSNVDTDEGFYLKEPFIPAAADSISLTTSAGTDTAAGVIHIPTRIVSIPNNVA